MPPVVAGTQLLSFTVTPSVVISTPANITATISGVTNESQAANNTATLSVTSQTAPPVVKPTAVAVPGLGGAAIAGLSGMLVLASGRRRRKAKNA